MVPWIASNVFYIVFSQILHIYPWRSNILLNESTRWHRSNSILLVLSKVTFTHYETWSIMCRISCHVYVYMTWDSWEPDSNGSGSYRIEYVHTSKCLINPTSWSPERWSLWLSLYITNYYDIDVWLSSYSYMSMIYRSEEYSDCVFSEQCGILSIEDQHPVEMPECFSFLLVDFQWTCFTVILPQILSRSHRANDRMH